jgi:hypothetical protein
MVAVGSWPRDACLPRSCGCGPRPLPRPRPPEKLLWPLPLPLMLWEPRLWLGLGGNCIDESTNERRVNDPLEVEGDG